MIATHPGRRTGGLFVCALATLALLAMSVASPPQAEARSFRTSTARASAPRPKPRPVVVHRTTVKNVVVHRTVNHVAPATSGGGSGFLSSFTGAAAGSALTNWFMNRDEPSEEQADAAPSEAPLPAADVPRDNPGS